MTPSRSSSSTASARFWRAAVRWPRSSPMRRAVSASAERAGVARMGAVDDEGQRLDRSPAAQPHPQLLEPIGAALHLAAPEISERARHVDRRNPERDALARAAAIEPQDQAGPAGCSATVAGIKAEAAVMAMEHRRPGITIGEARLPHQRAIGKEPAIVRSDRRRPRSRGRGAAPVPKSRPTRALSWRDPFAGGAIIRAARPSRETAKKRLMPRPPRRAPITA